MTQNDSAPTGTVTLVFTDIQGSTMLWERFRSDFKDLLDLHNAIIRNEIVIHEGYEVKTEGDAFMVAFSDARHAVQFCLKSQENLHKADWPQRLLEPPDLKDVAGVSEDGAFRGLRVRMGIHTGEPRCERDPMSGRMDYFGTAVNRAARVGGVGHGGQIVISESSYSQVQDDIDDVVVTDLGLISLKGLERPERIRQLQPGSLAERTFPCLKSQNVKNTNLPLQLDSFVGRDAELIRLREQFDDGARLVTLLGAAGTGKTRLAIQYGNLRLRDYPGGVWFCDLTEARNIDGICTAMASALQITVRAGRGVERIARALHDRGKILLILDNFEQIAEFAEDTIQAWAKESPSTHIITTSRERLQVDGESIFYVDPLTQSEAVMLFAERAAAVQKNFELSPLNEPDIIEIVERLDRMSLAIELAAARATIMSPKKILERLSERFKLLRGQRRNAKQRQATLHNAIDWSWQLLDPWEQLALAQISVFHGGFTLEAAEAIVSIEEWDDAPWVLDVLQNLVDKSLLLVRETLPGYERFFLYESIREYAASQLSNPKAIALEDGTPVTGSEAVDGTAARMATYFAGFGTEQYLSSLSTHGGVIRMRLLQLNLDNLLTSLHRAIASQDRQTATRALFATCNILFRTGPCLLAAECCQLVLKQLELPAKSHIRVLIEQGISLRLSGQRSAAQVSLKWALAKAEEINDLNLVASAKGEMGLIADREGDHESALQFHTEAVQLHRQIGNRSSEGRCLSNLGITYRVGGDFDKARAAYKAALDIHREVGNRPSEALALNNLANIYMHNSEFTEARDALLEAIAITEEVGNHKDRCIMLGNLGDLSLKLNQLDKAQEYLESSIELARSVGMRGPEGAFNGSIGELFTRLEQTDTARHHLDVGEKILRELGDLDELLKVLVRRTELELIEKDSAALQTVEEMKKIAGTLKLKPDSDAFQKIETLAQRAAAD